MGGDNERDNIIRLTPEEHFLAHQLLVKMFPGNAGLVYAAYAMAKLDHNDTRLNNKLFGWIRRAHSRVVGQQFSRKQSPEHIAKRTESMLATRERNGFKQTRKPETQAKIDARREAKAAAHRERIEANRPLKSAAAKARYESLSDEEKQQHKARATEHARYIPMSSEAKDRKSKRMKELWSDSDWRTEMLVKRAARKSPHISNEIGEIR